LTDNRRQKMKRFAVRDPLSVVITYPTLSSLLLAWLVSAVIAFDRRNLCPPDKANIVRIHTLRKERIRGGRGVWGLLPLIKQQLKKPSDGCTGEVWIRSTVGPVKSNNHKCFQFV